MSYTQPVPHFPRHQLINDPVELITFETDAGFDRGRPDGVFFPESTADVSKLLRWAQAAKVPIVARGAGTGLSGGAVAERGGIIAEFARLNHILEVDRVGRSAVVEPGVVNLELDTAAREAGLYFPPDPSSGRSALIGGNVGENSGGPHCFKYGVTTNYVTGLEVVLAGGRIVRTGGRAYDYPEYDLTGLLVGSEGTLGLITRCEVRLLRNPPAVKTLMASFHSDAAAGAAVSAIIAAGLVPATLEMMDRRVMGMIEAYVQAGLPVTAESALIVEVDGYAASLDSQVEEIAGILQAHGGYDLRIAQSEEERRRIWYGRKSAAGAFARLAPAFYLVDVTVPRSLLAETLCEINLVLERAGLQTGHVFHAGDGNLHPCILIDPQDADMMRRTFAACEEIVRICIGKDGSITGEHGVGIEKRAYMPMMYSGAELAAMRDVKQAFDPLELMNPGKILPATLPPIAYATPCLPENDIFVPGNTEDAAAGLAALAAAGKPVSIGASLAREDMVCISTASLRSVHKYAPDDLYVTVGAGMPLAELQAFLHAQQMQVSLQTPWPDATIGGLAAANINGPQRMKYGGWRDNLLCATVALASGRVIRAGRPVVKNVAGYDMAKVFVGSYGTLGLLCDITLKLAPLPRTRRTLLVPAAGMAQGIEWAQKTAQHWLATAGIVVRAVPALASASSHYDLLITLEGLAEDVDAELAELEAALSKTGAHGAVAIAGQSATEAWAEFVGKTGDGQCLVRIGVPPRLLGTYWAMILAGAPWVPEAFCDIANGLFYTRLAPDGLGTAQQWLDRLRQPALALGGYAIVMAAPFASPGAIDRWGYRPDGIEIMRRLKARWDPAGILNPGLFVL